MESVPSQASHDPPPGAAAIAVGRGSVSPCGAKLTAGDPRLTSVIFVAGEAPDVRPQSPDVGPDGVVVGEGVGVPAGVPVGDDGTVGRTVGEAVGVLAGVPDGDEGAVGGMDGEAVGTAPPPPPPGLTGTQPANVATATATSAALRTARFKDM
ncbi:hypothetical protein [Parafrankia soli]|uniref:hypothetical protein n=1 Tax=Parafrankia soli TaxID=2599596 RepID=UPI001F520570|nr:hypothetical protein [Parafrankia soli]